MLIVRWVPPEDLMRVVKSVLSQNLGACVRLVRCPIMDLPEEHPVENSPYIEVHPDGLIELWEFDGESHVLAQSIKQDVELTPDPEGTGCHAFFSVGEPRPSFPAPQPEPTQTPAVQPGAEPWIAPGPTSSWTSARLQLA